MSQELIDPRMLDSSVALGAHDGSALTSLNAGFTQGTEQATTSGTSVTFSGLPSGVQMIIVNIAGFSSSAANYGPLVQIGDAGGIETTSYDSLGGTTTGNSHTAVTTGFPTGDTNRYEAAGVCSGSFILTLEDAAAFTWVCQAMLCQVGGTATMGFGTGNKSLSAELTQVRFTTVAGSTFDAGAANIMYI